MTRIIIMIDLDAEDPAEAYQELQDHLDPIHKLDWESTNEWFNSDGRMLRIAEVEEARAAYFSDQKNQNRL